MRALHIRLREGSRVLAGGAPNDFNFRPRDFLYQARADGDVRRASVASHVAQGFDDSGVMHRALLPAAANFLQASLGVLGTCRPRPYFDSDRTCLFQLFVTEPRVNKLIFPPCEYFAFLSKFVALEVFGAGVSLGDDHDCFESKTTGFRDGRALRF